MCYDRNEKLNYDSHPCLLSLKISAKYCYNFSALVSYKVYENAIIELVNIYKVLYFSEFLFLSICIKQYQIYFIICKVL